MVGEVDELERGFEKFKEGVLFGSLKVLGSWVRGPMRSSQGVPEQQEQGGPLGQRLARGRRERGWGGRAVESG